MTDTDYQTALKATGFTPVPETYDQGLWNATAYRPHGARVIVKNSSLADARAVVVEKAEERGRLGDGPT